MYFFMTFLYSDPICQHSSLTLSLNVTFFNHIYLLLINETVTLGPLLYFFLPQLINIGCHLKKGFILPISSYVSFSNIQSIARMKLISQKSRKVISWMDSLKLNSCHKTICSVTFMVLTDDREPEFPIMWPLCQLWYKCSCADSRLHGLKWKPLGLKRGFRS